MSFRFHLAQALRWELCLNDITRYNTDLKLMTMETPLNRLIDPAPVSGLDDIKTDAATLARRYVRITSRQPNGMVAFEFSVGWPDMSVELALPEPQFNEFCSTHNVEFLTEAVGEKLGDQHDEH